MSEVSELSKQEPEAIQLQIEGTRAALADKIGALEQEVKDTVGVAKQSVQDTVDEVKKAFDFQSQIKEHPFLCVGGAMFVGFLTGRYLLAPKRRLPSHEGLEGEFAAAAPSAFGGLVGSMLSGVAVSLAREAAVRAFRSSGRRTEESESYRGADASGETPEPSDWSASTMSGDS